MKRSIKIKKNVNRYQSRNKIKGNSRKMFNKLKTKALINKINPYVTCELGNNGVYSVALIDSGADWSIISKKVFDKLLLSDPDLIVEEDVQHCITANSSKLILRNTVLIKIKIENFSWKFRFYINDELSVPIVLGCDFIHHTQLVPDLFNKRYYFNFRPQFKFSFNNNAKLESLKLQNGINVEQVNDDLSHVQKGKLEMILSKFDDILTERLGKTNLAEYKIRLVSDEPVRKAPYQLNPLRMEILNEKIKKMLSDGIIEKSTSNYSSPCFLVSKKDGGHRVVIDYRGLNKKIALDSTPLPNIENMFHWFHGAKYFSVLDLNQAYYQMPLAEESKHLTTFCTQRNTYQFTRVPFGISIGAQALSSVLDTLFEDIKFKFVLHYLDDIVIYSADFESHLKHIEIVLSKLRFAGFTIKPEKANFAKKQISFLGNLVDERGITIDPSRTNSIRNYPRPKNAKAISRFIGMTGYFHKYIKNYAEIAAPLNELRKKDAKFIWGEVQEKAFQALKYAIMNPPILITADFSKQFVLQTDGSSSAISAVLSQEIDGILKPIAFASKKLTQQECKYSIYEIECYAAIFGMERFRLYLQHAKFLLLTDNSALAWILKQDKQMGRLGRWLVRLLSFQFTTKHVEGKTNFLADALSRMYQDDLDMEELDKNHDVENVETELNLVNILKITDFPLVFTDIKQHQEKDPMLSQIIGKLSNNINQFPYSLSSGVLVIKLRNQEKLRIVIPKVLVPLVFKFYHESIIGGHLGISKTINKILENFHWDNLRKDIQHLVKSCSICAQSKPAQAGNYGFLSSKVQDEPLAMFHIDTVGPLIRSTNGNSYIFSCIDTFSRFVWLIPMRKANSDSVIKALKSIFVNVSTPKQLISDNGSIFTSNKFKNFCFQLGIRHNTTSPFYPNPNLVERLHRNLRSSLIAFHANSQNHWDESIYSWLPLAFNTAKHDSINCTPFSLMYRFKPRDPLLNIWNIDEILPDVCSDDTIEIWRKAKEQLLKTHNRIKQNYDKHRIAVPFQTGDLVWVKTHILSDKAQKISTKLSHRWRGPVKIGSFKTDVTVELIDPVDGRFIQKAHVSQLKKFYS